MESSNYTLYRLQRLHDELLWAQIMEDRDRAEWVLSQLRSLAYMSRQRRDDEAVERLRQQLESW